MDNEFIDAHHHLWRYIPPGQPWMSDGMEVLRRDFLVEDLRAAATGVGITGTIVVEAERCIEETLWQPNQAASGTRLEESLEEHLEIKRGLADMLTMELDAVELDGKVSRLRERVLHHAHGEEAKLFPAVRTAMTANELAVLGNELIVMFEHLIAAEPRKLVPDLTTEAASLPA